jgi:hypothetical protein
VFSAGPARVRECDIRRYVEPDVRFASPRAPRYGVLPRSVSDVGCGR